MRPLVSGTCSACARHEVDEYRETGTIIREETGTITREETGTIGRLLIAPASWVRSLPVGPRAGFDCQVS